MIKSQKVIVIAAIFLIIIASLFPPYKEPELNDRGELTGWHVKWEFNKNLRDLINPPIYESPDGWKSIEMWEYIDFTALKYLEILGIVVLAGVAFLINKKR